ncbi:MAG: prepilin-type N-terminal cleavage/methylation domain-containing protein [Alphaproteobacteria bacterium]|nr:prepilin-type N-terminal cleavage/methylation domain-containing protein [Alphaproteobacteria bacterium]
MSRRPLSHAAASGFSLIELLVAISLLSIVLLGGFTIFNTIQENYLREAGSSNQVREARSNADTLFITFHDNTSFSAASTTQWPADDGATDDNESTFSLVPLWGTANWLDDNGSYYCRVTALDAAADSFSTTSSCYTDRGVTESDLRDALIKKNLPNVILVGGSHTCIVTQAVTSSGTTTFTVLDDNCLSDASGTTLPTGANGAGVIFPRFAMNGARNVEVMSTLFYDHVGANRSGAGIYFGLESTWRDNSSTRYTVRGTSSDNFTNSWVNIHEFNERNTLTLNNPRGQTNMSLKVEVLDQLSSNGLLSLNAGGTGSSTSKHFYNRPADNISATLETLYVNASSASDTVDLRFTIGAGFMVWSRDLRLVIE